MFLETSGTRFAVNGSPIFLNGVNVYDFHTYTPDIRTPDDINGSNNIIPDPNGNTAEQAAAARIDAHMERIVACGFNHARIWGFSHGTFRATYNPGDQGNGTNTDTWHAFEPWKGNFYEPQFQVLDYIIDSATRNGVYLTIALENWFNAYGGVRARMMWEGVTINAFSDLVPFFDQSTPEGAAAYQGYLDYITFMVSRVNTVNGTAYVNEPGIGMWEIMNEPRLYPATPEAVPGTIMGNFFDAVEAHIKAIDGNHLVSTGQEGQGQQYGYFGNGAENGAPFTLQANKDLASAHIYTHVAGAGSFTVAEYEAILCAHKDAADAMGKPYYVGELGTPDDVANVMEYYEAACKVASEKEIAGVAWWWFPDGQWNQQPAGEPFIAIGDAKKDILENCFAQGVDPDPDPDPVVGVGQLIVI